MPTTRSQKVSTGSSKKQPPPHGEDNHTDENVTDDDNQFATQQELFETQQEESFVTQQDALLTQQPEVSVTQQDSPSTQQPEVSATQQDNGEDAEEAEGDDTMQAPDAEKETEENPVSNNGDDDDDDDDDDDEGEDVGGDEEGTHMDDESLAITADLIELKSEMVLLSREHRKMQWESLEYFWQLYPFRGYAFGRVYTRRALARLVLISCAEMPYAPEDELDEEFIIRPLEEWSRRYWKEFEKHIEEVHSLCLRKDTKHLFNVQHDNEDIEKYDKPEETNSKNMNDELFTTKFGVLMKLVEVQKCLAPIRCRVEAAVDAEKDPDFSQSELEEVIEYSKNCERAGVHEIIQELFVQDVDEPTLKSHKSLARILEEDKSPFGLRYFQKKAEVLFQKWNRHVFGATDPTLLHLRYRVDAETQEALKLPRNSRWSLTPLQRPKENSTQASSLRSSSQKKSASKKKSSATRREMEELRRSRGRLNDRHGEDPLESSRKVAQKAVRSATKTKTATSPAASLTKRRSHNHQSEEANDSSTDDDDEDGSKKPRARTTVGSDDDHGGRKARSKKRARSDDDDGDDDNHNHNSGRKKRARTGQGRLYEKKKSAKSLHFLRDIEADDEEDEQEAIRLSQTPSKVNPFPKTYSGKLPDEGVFDENGKVTKRRRWTTEEKIAVRQGVQEFGLGKWVEIKQKYSDILHNRTNVQCKDCWRTMVKKGEASLDDAKSEDEEEEVDE